MLPLIIPDIKLDICYILIYNVILEICMEKIYKIHFVYGKETEQGILVDGSDPLNDYFEDHTAHSLKEYFDEVVVADKQSFTKEIIGKQLKKGYTFCFMCEDTGGLYKIFLQPEPESRQAHTLQ